MKKRLVLLLIASVFSGQIYADALTTLRRIVHLEVRESGYHSLYIARAASNENPRSFPDEGCDLVDRGVIDETTSFGSALLDVAKTAYLEFRVVKLKVSGCVGINGPNTATAPRIVKIELYRESSANQLN